MPNLAAVIPTWRDGALLASCVRSVRPHVDVVLCLDGGYVGEVAEEDDLWSPGADLLAAQEAGAVLYPVIERNASEAEYARRAPEWPADYEPLPTTLDPPLSAFESYETKVEALLGLARRHIEHGWVLIVHADELLICGDGLRDELRPFYDCAAVRVPRWGSEDDVGEDWPVRLYNLGVEAGPFGDLPAAPGAPFLRHRAYLRRAVVSR